MSESYMQDLTNQECSPYLFPLENSGRQEFEGNSSLAFIPSASQTHLLKYLETVCGNSLGGEFFAHSIFGFNEDQE